MPFEFCLPAIAEGGAEGFVVNWFKDEGQAVKAGELLLEVQFEKVSTEVTAPRDGVLARILAPSGTPVRVGQPLCLIATPASSESIPSTGGQATPTAATGGSGREVRATPSARRVARELGVEITAVPGTGPGGRIGEEDVRRYAAALAADSTEADGATTPTPVGTPSRIPLSPAQRVTGVRMLQSLRETAQYTLGREVEVTALISLRQQRKAAGSPISLTDLLHRAVVLALAQHPRLQGQLQENDLLVPQGIHLGFAVARNDDLLVPVIREAHQMDLAALAAERQRLTAAVQDGRVTPAELQGATFTVSNLGPYGVDFFTPVLNPPQSAILGVGRTVERLVMAGRAIQPVQFISLCLTLDHRVINGATGSAFLATLADLLASPEGWAGSD